MRVYLAAPHRGPPAPAGALDAMRAAIEGAGHAIVNALPGPASKALLADVERRAFVAEMDLLQGADLLIAEVSSPSAGVGWRVAWFLARGRLVILCCRRDWREQLSTMLIGNPSPWQRLVLYDAPEELETALARELRGG